VIPEKQKILIVDDAPANIRILGQALAEDYQLRIATNGARALEIVKSDTPDIILLDIIMPEMDGYDVCKRLKEDELTRNIPVIFVTGKTDEEHEFRGLELGAVDYIGKPFSIPIVKARVKNHLELKRRGDLLEELAFLDGLTCIHNRRRFDEVLDQEWRRALREGIWFTVMIIDVDFFKLFNDCYGHGAGDKCLRQVAQTLKQSFSRAGDFVARCGGEEFAAVLTGTGLDDAIECAQKLREELASINVKHASSPISDHVTVSIGTASVQPCHESSAAEVLKIADQMLYSAKREGRDRVKSWPQTGV
jgi:diguanylate cyclase (GGDEF)-like protein